MDRLEILRQELVDGLSEDGFSMSEIQDIFNWIDKEVDQAVSEIKEIIDA